MGVNFVLIIKVVNIITALTLVGFGIAGIIFLAINSITSGKFFLIFSPVFMILFGLMLLAAQFKFEILINHFTFLKSMLGRGIFNIYLASSVFFYFSCQDSNVILAWVAGMSIFALGIAYIVLHFCGPKDQTNKDEKVSKDMSNSLSVREPMV